MSAPSATRHQLAVSAVQQPEVRQSLLYIVNQVDMIRPTFANPKWYSTCGKLFHLRHADGERCQHRVVQARPDLEKAKQLMKEGGYDGTPVVMLQATNIPYMMNAATVMAQEMRQAGYNVQLLPMDWANVVQRRANKTPPDKGGWNIFFTSGDGMSGSNPYMSGGMATNGERVGSAGRPTRRTRNCARSGSRRKRVRAEEDRPRDPGECLEHRAAHVLWPMGAAGGVSQEHQRLAACAGSDSVLERGKDLMRTG